MSRWLRWCGKSSRSIGSKVAVAECKSGFAAKVGRFGESSLSNERTDQFSGRAHGRDGQGLLAFGGFCVAHAFYAQQAFGIWSAS